MVPSRITRATFFLSLVLLSIHGTTAETSINNDGVGETNNSQGSKLHRIRQLLKFEENVDAQIASVPGVHKTAPHEASVWPYMGKQLRQSDKAILEAKAQTEATDGKPSASSLNYSFQAFEKSAVIWRGIGLVMSMDPEDDDMPTESPASATESPASPASGDTPPDPPPSGDVPSDPSPPSEIVPSESPPSDIMPSEIVPSETPPSDIMPSDPLPPSEIVPSETPPSDIMPSEIMPSETPSSTMPSDRGYPSVTEHPSDSSTMPSDTAHPSVTAHPSDFPVPSSSPVSGREPVDTNPTPEPVDRTLNPTAISTRVNSDPPNGDPNGGGGGGGGGGGDDGNNRRLIIGASLGAVAGVSILAFCAVIICQWKKTTIGPPAPLPA